MADNTESGAFIDCLSCFLNNECSEEYFKTTVQGTEYCTYLADTRQHYLCEAVYRSFKKTKKSKICGDVNQDYFVNNKDITMLWKYIDGEIELTEQQKTNANVNKDSFIDQYDANIIFYYTSNMVMGLDCASPSSNEEGQTDAKEWILGN